MVKRIVLGIFIAAALFFTAWGVNYVTSPLNSVNVTTDTVENVISDENAVIIREEQVYYSDISGTLYNNVADGDRVAKDSLISTVFNGVISDDNLNELRTIDKKIERRRANLSSSSIYTADSSDIESKIASIIRDIAPTGENNDIMRISDYKDDINNLRNGVEISDTDVLNSLLLEKESIENRISTNKSEIMAGMSGIFMTYIDGLESTLKPEDIETYTVESIRSLVIPEARRLANKTVEEGGAVCKIANNHVWYAALEVPTAEIDKHQIGDSVTLRFNSIGGQTIEGELYFISQNDENGSKLAVVRCPSYFEGAFSYRSTDIDMIFESYTGVKVPIYAIRNDESGQYVIAMSGSAEYKCYCDILYTDIENEFVIIRSSEISETNLEDMDRIIIGER